MTAKEFKKYLTLFMKKVYRATNNPAFQTGYGDRLLEAVDYLEGIVKQTIVHVENAEKAEKKRGPRKPFLF